MPRYMRGKRRFEESTTLGEKMAAGEDMKQDFFKTVAEAMAWAEKPEVKAFHMAACPTNEKPRHLSAAGLASQMKQPDDPG